jgi:hypothetical protein
MHVCALEARWLTFAKSQGVVRAWRRRPSSPKCRTGAVAAEDSFDERATFNERATARDSEDEGNADPCRAAPPAGEDVATMALWRSHS